MSLYIGRLSTTLQALWELAERLGDVRNRGLTEEEVSRLPSKRWGRGSAGKEGCSICLTDYTPACMVTSLTCSHAFHRDCVGTWLQVFIHSNNLQDKCAHDFNTPVQKLFHDFVHVHEKFT